MRFRVLQVGRALGPSILDLTGCNPLSRIQNTDFKTVTGLRHALRFELERDNPRSLVFNSAVPSNKVIIPRPMPLACAAEAHGKGSVHHVDDGVSAPPCLVC